MADHDITDPIERIIATALQNGNIRFTHEASGHEPSLDFYLPDFDVFIEVKQFHTHRIGQQMAKADNVIAIQGRGAAHAFARMIAR